MENKIILGDCLDKLKDLDTNSVDSIVTDPPYELGFMGKSWDNTGIANNKEMWAECLRVLKPGGYLLSFGGTRTYHRMAVAIEDAGFEVRDMIEWVYGSGFPKSLNIGKAVDKLQGNERVVFENPRWAEKYPNGPGGNLSGDGRSATFSQAKRIVGNTLLTSKGTSEWEGWGTALKPAHEPICMARKPLEKGLTVAENCLKWNVGGLNVDASRVSSDLHESDDSTSYKDLSRKGVQKTHKQNTDHQGEFVSSPLLQNDHLANDGKDVQNLKSPQDFQSYCLVCPHPYDERPQTEVKDDLNVSPLLCDAHGLPFRSLTSPDNPLLKSSSYKDNINIDVQSQGRFPANLIHDNSEEVRECFPDSGNNSRPNSKRGSSNWVGGDRMERLGISDSGNASRFFKSIIYQAKASKSERNKGCEDLEEKVATARMNASEFRYEEGREPTPRAEQSVNKNNHPTVKPIALMEYLIKMVTPKGGIVLDPFAGSGSTLVAAKQNGFKYIGIEMTPEYIPIIEARLKDNTLF